MFSSSVDFREQALRAYGQLFVIEALSAIRALGLFDLSEIGMRTGANTSIVKDFISVLVSLGTVEIATDHVHYTITEDGYDELADFFCGVAALRLGRLADCPHSTAYHAALQQYNYIMMDVSARRTATALQEIVELLNSAYAEEERIGDNRLLGTFLLQGEGFAATVGIRCSLVSLLRGKVYRAYGEYEQAVTHLVTSWRRFRSLERYDLLSQADSELHFTLNEVTNRYASRSPLVKTLVRLLRDGGILPESTEGWLEHPPAVTKRVSLTVVACQDFSDTALVHLLNFEPLRSEWRKQGLDVSVVGAQWGSHLLDSLSKGHVDAVVYNKYETVQYAYEVRHRPDRPSLFFFDAFAPVSGNLGSPFYLLARATKRNARPTEALADRYADIIRRWEGLSMFSAVSSEENDSVASSELQQLEFDTKTYIRQELGPYLAERKIIAAEGDMARSLMIFLRGARIKAGRVIREHDTRDGFHLFVRHQIADVYFGGQDQLVFAQQLLKKLRVIVDGPGLRLAGIQLPSELQKNAVVVTERVAQTKEKQLTLLHDAIYAARTYIHQEEGIAQLSENLRLSSSGFTRSTDVFMLQKEILKRNPQAFVGLLPDFCLMPVLTDDPDPPRGISEVAQPAERAAGQSRSLKAA